MSKTPSPKTKFAHVRGVVLSSLLLLALAGLTACGGGSSLREITTGGGGGGGGGNGAACALINQPTLPSNIVTGGVGSSASPTFMDLHVGSSDILNTVTVPYGSLRLWDTGTGWAQINTAPGTYNFSSNLDGFVTSAPSGVDLLYNLARTPNWASFNPNDSSCAYNTTDYPNGGGNGQCWYPQDLSTDGSGTDQDWIDWVSAVATQNKNVYNYKIKYFEIWNEWNIQKFWQGTPAQLARMEQDARCIVEGPPAGYDCTENNSNFTSGTGINKGAGVMIVTPSPVGAHTDLNEVGIELASYFAAAPATSGIPGGTFADIIGFHGYVGTASGAGLCPSPEEVTTVVTDLSGALTLSEVGKPWFNTEGGWSKASDEGFTDPDRQAAFLARYFILQRSLGVDRIYWYRWDATSTYGGALWTSSTGPTEAASAWSEVNQWLVGATVSSACTANGTVWSCGLTRSGGYQALAVWDTSQDCSNGNCMTKNYTVPSGYNRYLDLTNASTTTSAGSTIQIGAKPILLENGTLP